jgi:glycosyltransferase involved in cell wall biosynthesis
MMNSVEAETKVSKPTCSTVVPVYKTAETLSLLVDRLGNVLPGISESYEVILVDDSSMDNSWALIEQLAEKYPWVVGIQLMRNYGQHNALLCGIRQARYDVIVTLDDDLQNPPEEIPFLLAELDKGFDVVYGVPQKEQHGLWRDLASRVTKLVLQTTMGVRMAREVSAFRAFRTELRKGFEQYTAPLVMIDVLLSWGTSRFSAVTVRHEPRANGGSNYTFRKLVTHALNMVTGFSTLPLRFASLLGFLFTLFGAGVLVYVVGRYFLQGSIPGFPFLASIITIFSGVQLLTLGIFGEYMARLYDRVMGRPTYVIEKIYKGRNR